MESDVLIGIIQIIVEITIGIIGLFGLSYLIKINRNQKSYIGDNSSGNKIIQVQGDYKEFKQESKNITTIFGDTPLINENKKELITKIENYLEKDKPLSIIAELSLRLAKELKMTEDEKWLHKEVYGFKEYLEPEDDLKGMIFRKIKDKIFDYRVINAELNLQFKNHQPEKFPLRFFISHPISQIESWVFQDTTNGRIPQADSMIMSAPPLKLMVETLKINPYEKVPYVLSRNSLKEILIGIRLRIIDFLNRARAKVD